MSCRVSEDKDDGGSGRHSDITHQSLATSKCKEALLRQAAVVNMDSRFVRVRVLRDSCDRIHTGACWSRR